MADLRPERRSLRATPKLAILRKPDPSPEANAPIPLRVGPVARIVIRAGGTGLFITCLYSAYGPASVGDMNATVVMLASGWVFAVGAFTLSELLSPLSNRHRILASLAFAVSCAAVVAIWGVMIFHPPQPPSVVEKTGARIFLSPMAIIKGNSTVQITVLNSGDSIARMKSQVGTTWILSPRILTEQEEDHLYREALNHLPNGGSGVELQANSSRIVQIDVKITDDEYESIVNGSNNLYVVTVSAFTDAITPAGKTNLASMCTRFNKSTTIGLICMGHNESRSSP